MAICWDVEHDEQSAYGDVVTTEVGYGDRPEAVGESRVYRI